MNLAAIKHALLSNPAGINATAVIDRLAKKHFGSEAKYLLDRVVSAQVMDGILKNALPAEWSKIKGNAFLRCRELCKIINRDYFPFREDVFEEWCFEAAHGDMEIEVIDIPLETCGHGGWIHERSFEDLSIEQKIIDLLEGDTDGYVAASKTNFAELRRTYGVADSFQHTLKKFAATEFSYYDKLYVIEESLDDKPNPAKYFSLAFRAYHLSTDNLFFDWDDEAQFGSGEVIEWTPENLKRLKAEYEEAKPIIRKLASLNKWLEAKPKERIEYILKQIGKTTDEKKSKPKPRRIKIQTLVDVFSGSNTDAQQD